MGKGLRIVLFVVAAIVALVAISILVLYAAGGQDAKDPFTTGIDVIDAPYTLPATVTWRIVGEPATTTVLYVSKVSRPAQDGFAPEDLGYTTTITPTTTVIDGVTLYRADVPKGTVYVRVYADIDGPKWSQEYLMEDS